MDKLTISKEQAEALKNFKNNGHVYDPFERFIERKRTRDEFKHDKKSLNDFTPQQFALLLCGWYEVEQPFKVGDWMYNKSTENVYQMKQEDVNYLKNAYANEPINHLRLATPEEIAQEKERRRWAEIGREVDQYKVRDIVSKNGNIQEISDVFRDGWKIQTYATPVYNDELTLICPVERRLDT